jgi:hypothetical protein
LADQRIRLSGTIKKYIDISGEICKCDNCQNQFRVSLSLREEDDE